jgi:glutathione S-transferase
MLTLHRFPLSHFSEKGRALLAFKRLDFRIVDHQLGLPQLRIYKLSGQRRVPVIEHDGIVVADSTQIALYLEREFPETRPLLPADESQRRDALALEERLDRVFGLAPGVVWFDSIVGDRERLARVLEIEVFGAGAIGSALLSTAIQRGWRFERTRRFTDRSARATHRMLEELCDRLKTSKFLVGNIPTLADIAAVGLAMHLEFPPPGHSPVPELAGDGVPGWADDPSFARFFEWRRRFYSEQLGA